MAIPAHASAIRWISGRLLPGAGLPRRLRPIAARHMAPVPTDLGAHVGAFGCIGLDRGIALARSPSTRPGADCAKKGYVAWRWPAL